MVTVILDQKFDMKKDRLMELMSERGIDCRPFFHPLSSLPAYEKLERAQQARQRNFASYRISPYGLNLPSGLNVTEEKVKYVCATLKQILQK
jgi:perosamine synthetase